MNFFSILYTIIIYPLYQLIEFSFDLFQRLFKIPGISVIGVSVTVSLFCLPLYIIAGRWQQVQRDTEKKLDPGIKRIKATFKGDEQYMILSTFYRENKYSPIMALRSSFGLLIQIPFFFFFYIFLSNLSTLRGASFLFIRDMGSQVALFHIGSFPVNVLPIAMTLINIIAGAIYTKGFKLKDKLQIYGMALVFLVLLYNSPSGLVLYWTMNNVFSLVKNIFYKIKKPLLVLYISLCIFLVALISIVMYKQPVSTQMSIAFSLGISVLFFTPLIVKFVNYLLNTILKPLVEDSKKRFTLFACTSVALAFFGGFFIPSLVVSSSAIEFSGIDGYGNPSYFIYNTMLQCVGIFIIWPCCIYFLFHKRIQTIITVTFVFMLFTSMLNVFCFSGSYGSLGRLITFMNPTWPGVSKTIQVVSLLSLIVIFAAILLLVRFKLIKVLTFVSALSFVAFTGVTVSNFITINKDYKKYQELADSGLSNKKSIEPVYHLSKTGKNVVVFMLDRAENAYCKQIFSEYPEISEAFTGFTLYRNTLSYAGHTIMGAPPFFGGYEYTPLEFNNRPSEKLIDKNNQALVMLPRIFTEQAGWDAYISDPSWGNFSWISDMSIFSPYPKIHAMNVERNYTQYFLEKNPTVVDQSVSEVIKRNLIFYSLFRSISPALRKTLYNEGKWWQPTRSNGDIRSFIDYYSGLYYLPQLTAIDDTNNSFVSITNETTHENLNLDSLGCTVDSSAIGYSENVIAYKALASWISYLKQNDCYDNTRIIIGSDHGNNSQDGYNLDFTGFDIGINPDEFHPLLMVKDFGCDGPLTVDDTTLMTNADVASLALKDTVPGAYNPFTLKKIVDTIP